MNRRTRALRTARAALAITVLASSFAMGPLQTSGAVSPFGDVAGHPFAADIEWLRRSGITGGCAPNRFCPDEPVTREQMASFLVRARGLPATATDHFVDDEASAHETDINRLASAGVTTGCAAGRFCPSGQVTRQEMASFLVRAFGLPATTEDYFWDDDGSAHRADIDRLAASGITGGCGPGRFCPGQVVTRGQMAAFLRRALESPLAPPPVAGCSLFPATNVWNKPIDALPVASGSATLISTIGANSPLHPDFGSYLGYGIPYNVVGGSTPRSSVSFDYASESDPGRIPYPPTHRSRPAATGIC